MWPLNSKVMDEKTRPNEIYTIEPNNTLDQEDYNSENSMKKA
jgi:hypothetical protein